MVEKFGIGQPVRRAEDRRFITGSGRYLDDLHFPGEAVASVLRSPHAHARIRSIDARAARSMPGVALVATAADLAADAIGTVPVESGIVSVDGKPLAKPPHAALAGEVARHVGDGVALIVAESLAQAKDAAEAIVVDYEPLAAVTDLARAVLPGAPGVWPDVANNICYDWVKGDSAAVEAALAGSAHVTRLRLVNNRVTAAPMETRGAIGLFEAGRFTLHATAMNVHRLKRHMATILGTAPENVRVLMPDVGGGFGLKNFTYPEMILVLWAARKLGRPVRWVAERSEGFACDAHGRDNVSEAELGFDAAGRVTALRVRTLANLGAYLSTNGPNVPTGSPAAVTGGVYAIPAIVMSVKGVFTNTAPVDAYRGAGRPEDTYVIERLMDRAARELKIDRAELRRRNMIKQFPFKTALGTEIDCGDFVGVQEKALGQADQAGFAARRAQSQARGMLRGLGFATYFEVAGGPPQESTELRFEADGTVTLTAGTQSHGQGHETAYGQMLHDWLGIPPDRMRFVQGDSDAIAVGSGYGGSRVMQTGGVALRMTATAVEEKARQLASHLLEAAPVDLEFADGAFTIAGTDRKLTLFEVARRAREDASLPAGLPRGIDSTVLYVAKHQSYPNGCHVVEVEIDPETGRVRLDRYTVVDDFGRVINPLLIAGQVHGGIAQGVGQALMEHSHYDGDSGQLIAGSFMDYAMPRADDLPGIAITHADILTANNILGVKGSGEAGCVGALAAVVNAVLDALGSKGVTHIDMPVTAPKVWRALNGGA